MPSQTGTLLLMFFLLARRIPYRKFTSALITNDSTSPAMIIVDCTSPPGRNEKYRISKARTRQMLQMKATRESNGI